jgi:cytochrome c oxidase assembly protein subunit 15
MIASTVGFLTIILTIWTWRAEPRRWVRWLAVAALGAVVLQGVLGGLTVLLLLPPPVSIGHAALAQLFLCLTLALAVFTSPRWIAATGPVDDARLRRLAATTTALVYGQILLGATMRHTGAGLAIPDFPLVFGGLLPPSWTAPVAVHFAHRMGALIVTGAVVVTASRVWRYRDCPELRRPMFALVGFLCIQIALGAAVVLTRLQTVVNTAHVVNGALVLGSAFVLTLRTFRPVFDRASERAARPIASAARPLGARS